MAINQGLRQGPMTSTDTPPPQHTFILSGRVTHALLQTRYATASSFHFVVYVPIPQRQRKQKALYTQNSRTVIFSFPVRNHIITVYPVHLNQKWHLKEGEIPPRLIPDPNSCSLLTRPYAFICCGEPAEVMQMRDDSVIVWGISME